MGDEAGHPNYWILLDGEPARDDYRVTRDRKRAFRYETEASIYFILQHPLVNSQRGPYDVLLGIEWGQMIVWVRGNLGLRIIRRVVGERTRWVRDGYGP